MLGQTINSMPRNPVDSSEGSPKQLPNVMIEVQMLKSIFGHASELARGETRSAYLDSVCGDNAQLRQQVDRMLAALDSDRWIMEPGTLVEAAATIETTQQVVHLDLPSTFQSGTVIADHFELIEPLGEGGMGTVWKARQLEPVNRRVAIKFVKSAFGTSRAVRQAIERFDRERQVLATLDHPHIARIIDGGQTESGTPFVVMELVDGISLTNYVRSNSLDLQQRLHLFSNICDAVRHAHQKGIIHRDLKPSNILVSECDGQHVPKVIDFGLAKWLSNESMLEEALDKLSLNLIVGTPLYMPPERILAHAGEADVRDDVYSLGVLLFELLTGSTPVEARQLNGLTWEQVLQLIRESNPIAPSQRIAAQVSGLSGNEKDSTGDGSKDCGNTLPPLSEKQVRGELDWITQKALAPERERRFGSVDALAADITAFLNGDPILAAPPSHWYRVQKLLRRHRVAVIATSTILVSLIAGIVATTSAMFWALNEKQRAQAAELKAEQELARSLEVKRLITRMFEGITPQKAKGGDIAILRSILDDTAGRLVSGEIEDELIQAEMHLLVGDVYRQLGGYNSAEAQLSSARSLFHSVFGDDHEQTLNARFKLAQVQYRQGRFDDALDQYQSIHSDACRALGEEHPNSIAVLNAISAVHFDKGRFHDSEALFRAVLDLQKRVLGPEHPDTLATMNNMATLYRSMDEFQQAESLYLAVREARQRTLTLRHPNTLNTLNGLANLYADRGRYDEAEELYRQCVGLRTEIMGSDHPDTLMSLNNLALLLKEKGSLQEAQTIFEQLMEAKTSSSSLGPEHPSTLQTMNNLALLYADLGRSDEAEALYRKTLARRQKVLSPTHPDTLATLNNLGVLFEGQERWEEAESIYLEVLAAKNEALGPTHRDTELTMLNLGNLYLAMGQIEEAEALFQTVLDQTIKRGHTDTPSYRRAQQGLERAKQSKSPTFLELP